MLSKEDKERAVEQFRRDHQLYFDTIGVNVFNYYPKMIYMHGNIPCMALFPSEFSKIGGFFTELISFDFTPETPRRLYKMMVRPDFSQRYPVIQGSTERYAVPITDFEAVNTSIAFMGRDVSIPKSAEQEIEDVGKAQEAIRAATPIIGLPDPNSKTLLPDKPYSEMTLRDHMAILTWKPISNDEWINDIIKTTKKTK